MVVVEELRIGVYDVCCCGYTTDSIMYFLKRSDGWSKYLSGIANVVIMILLIEHTLKYTR
jgi:hypothetical protein